MRGYSYALESSKCKLTAIFSEDVATKAIDYLMGELEEAIVRTSTAYGNMTSRPIQQNRGRVVHSYRDNFRVEFATVLDGVNRAIEIQRKPAGGNAGLPENRWMQFPV